MTLLGETELFITGCGKNKSDIDWVGSKDGKYVIKWDEFRKIADFEYDNGFGGQEIATDLVVVFKNGDWIERHEYDGSEWWEFKTTPKMKDNARPFSRVKDDSSWNDLEEMNK